MSRQGIRGGTTRSLDEVRAAVRGAEPRVLSGYCQCGCGQRTRLSAMTNQRLGLIKGKPRRFVKGHNGRQLPIVRFIDKVVETEKGCWEWTGSVGRPGYGRFNLGGHTGPIELAHRFSYEFFVGPIPDGLVIDHLCRNRVCVNPAHLETVTLAVNTQRGALAKLNPESVRLIRSLQGKRSVKEIAAVVGVSKERVEDVLCGRGWTNIEGSADA